MLFRARVARPPSEGPSRTRTILPWTSTPAQSSRLPYVPVPPWPAKTTSPATSPLGEPPWGAKSRPTSSRRGAGLRISRSEEHTSELQSRPHLVCRLLLEKKQHSPFL